MRTDVTDALTRAFFEEWSRTGYAALSLERVARVAGVGKAALYRRWSDKAAMASDLLSGAGLSITEVDEQESLEQDLLAVMFAIRRVLRHPRIRRIVTDLHAEIERTPTLGNGHSAFSARPQGHHQQHDRPGRRARRSGFFARSRNSDRSCRGTALLANRGAWRKIRSHAYPPTC